MKIRRNVIVFKSCVIAVAMVAVLNFASWTLAKPLKAGETGFLQTIQGLLAQASGTKTVAILVIAEKKRKISVTPDSIILSHGFLKDIKNIHQLVATLAHLTAYIKLGYAVTLPEKSGQKHGNTSLESYLKSAVRPRYRDEGYMPEAKGTFQENQPETITRPGFQNREYEYSINKSNILTAERELEIDKITDTIMRRAGFCPEDYSRLLHYFYENPKKFPENKHFTLEVDQWQRIDAADQRADPAVPCNKAQITRTRKYAGDFRRLENRINEAD